MELETFFEQFELLADAPNGVQKLRELILQLAVQGKLVPQNPHDEPAEVLLERIREEKKRLVKEKKIRKSQPLPPVKTDEVPFSLPPSWEWVRLDSICNQITDGAHHTPTYTPTGIPFLSVKDVSGGKIDLTNTRYISKETHEKLINRCKPEFHDVLLTKVGTTGIAKVIDVNIEFSIFVSLALLKFSQHLLSPYYLEVVINSPLVKAQSEKNTQGIGNKNLVLKCIKNFIFPLPPLPEQHCIVAKVDRLMSLCDELEARQEKRHKRILQLGEVATSQLITPSTPEAFNQHWQGICDNFDLLYSTPENVSQLRQAILQLAVMGKLVPQDANDEPAEVLLERIREEKARLLKEGKIKKGKELPPIDVDEMPFELPDGWEWVRLGETAKVIEYGTSYKSVATGEKIPIFRMNNIQNGQIILDALKYVPDSIKDLPRLYLKNNDILFNRTNSYELVGKTGIFKGKDNQYTFASYLIRVSLFFDYINPEFVNVSMNSSYFRQTQIEPEITQQCGQANFNGTKLKHSIIPLPPLSEQHRIVAKVDRLMSLCDELEAKLTQSISDTEKLMETAVSQVLVA